MKKIIGIVEFVTLRGSKKEKKVKAKVDTGASRSSLCKSLLNEIGETPIIKKVLVKNPMSKEIRPLIRLKVKLNKNFVSSTFTVTARTDMRYKVLLGKNTLKKLNVLIDPLK